MKILFSKFSQNFLKTSFFESFNLALILLLKIHHIYLNTDEKYTFLKSKLFSVNLNLNHQFMIQIILIYLKHLYLKSNLFII